MVEEKEDGRQEDGNISDLKRRECPRTPPLVISGKVVGKMEKSTACFQLLRREIKEDCFITFWCPLLVFGVELNEEGQLEEPACSLLNLDERMASIGCQLRSLSCTRRLSHHALVMLGKGGLKEDGTKD